MDLAQQFEVDSKLADEGVWFEFMNDARVKIRAANTPSHRAAVSEISERYRAQLRIGGPVGVEARMAIRADVAGSYLIADWENITENGVPLEPTTEIKIASCKKYFDLLIFAESCSSELVAYRVSNDAVAAGN